MAEQEKPSAGAETPGQAGASAALDPTLSVAACAALERALNFALGLDPQAAENIAAHTGRIVKLHADNPPLALYIELGARCRVMYHSPGEADVALGGALGDWFELARSEDKAAALVNGDLAIDGDSRILLALADAAGKLDIDWEAQLAEVVGDVPAHLTARALRYARQLGAQAAGVAQLMVDGLLEQHEAGSRVEGDLVGQGLRALSAGLEKIAAQHPATASDNTGEPKR